MEMKNKQGHIVFPSLREARKWVFPTTQDLCEPIHCSKNNVETRISKKKNKTTLELVNEIRLFLTEIYFRKIGMSLCFFSWMRTFY